MSGRVTTNGCGRRRWRRCFLALLLAASLLAAGHLPLCAQDVDTPEPDTRLEQKITLDVSSTKLADVCAKISEMTGVAVKAGESDREWRVSERLVTIHASDMRLGSLLDELSRLLGFRLSRAKKDGQFAYLFWQDRNSKNLEADLLNSQNAEAAERAADMRENTLSAARDALAMNESGALAERDKNPWLAYLGGTIPGRAYAALLGSIEKHAPIERDLMLRGKRATIDLANLPPEAAQFCRQMMEGGFIGAEIKKRDQQSVFQSVVPKRITVLGSEMMGEQSAGLIGFGGLVIVLGEAPGAEGQPAASDAIASPFGRGVPLAIMPLASTDSVMGKAFGRMLFAVDEGASMEDANKQLVTEFSNPAVFAEALARPSATAASLPNDPLWTREVDLGDVEFGAEMEQLLSGQNRGKSVSFSAISEALGKPVVAESFRSMMPVSLFLTPGKQPAYRLLVALEKAGYEWQMGAAALRVRPADWALQRSCEIPESFLKHYRDLLDKQQELTLDQIAAMTAALTDRQIQNNLLGDPDLSPAVASALASPFGGRDALRLYGSLAPAQKKALTTGAGLPFSSLDGKQWDLMSGILADYAGGVEIADGTVRLDTADPLKANRDKMPAMSQVQFAQFKIAVQVPDEEAARDIGISVMYPTKEQIKAIRDATKAAREQMEKARKEREKKSSEPSAQK